MNMRKILIILLIAMFLFSFAGCSFGADDKTDLSKLDYSDTYIEGQDSQENYIASDFSGYFASIGNSYYFMNKHFIYQVDKETHKCSPLCNKSDCLHDKETNKSMRAECQAYVEGADPEETLIAYGNNLYYHSTEMSVDRDGVEDDVEAFYRISPDTGERTSVYKIKGYALMKFKIHRGYIYFKAVKFKKDSNDAFSDNADIIRVPLKNSNEEPEILLDVTEIRKQYKNGFIGDVRLYGNHLFAEINYDKSSKEAGNTLLSYDLDKKEWIDIKDKTDVNFNVGFTVFNDRLILREVNSGIYECGFSGENCKNIIKQEELIKGYNIWIPFANDGKSLFITTAKDDENISDLSSFYSNKIIIADRNYNTTVTELPVAFAYVTIGFDDKCFLNMSENELLRIDKSTLTKEIIYEFEN